MDILLRYLEYPFVQTAFVVGALIALCSSLIGVPLILRRCSFVGDSLSHTAFLATTVAALLGLTNLGMLTPIVVIAVSFVMLRRKSAGDSFLAMVSVLTLAVGYVAINLSGSGNVSGDVCGVLFGSTSILTLKSSDIATCIVLFIVVLVLFLVTYHRTLRITFDRDYAKVNGENTLVNDILFSIMIGSVVSIAVSFVGALLVTALIVLPTSAAMLVCKSYKKAVITSCVISVLCALCGMAVSIIKGTPVGSTVVIVDALVLFVIFLGRKVVCK